MNLVRVVLASVIFSTCVRSDVEVSFAEGNVLYHFNDLAEVFNYVDEQSLDYFSRSQSTVRYMNEMQADASCFVEWTGNKFHPAYIGPEQDKLHIKTDFDKGMEKPECFPSKESEVMKLIEKDLAVTHVTDPKKVKLIATLLNDFVKEKKWGYKDECYTLLTRVRDRYLSIHAFYKLNLMQDESYNYRIFNKKWGRAFKNGIPVKTGELDEANPGMKDGLIPEAEPADPYDPKVIHTQSILMAWNKTKFEPANTGFVGPKTPEHIPEDELDNEDYYEVYLPINDKKADGQNFIVKRLRVRQEPGKKEVPVYVTLICTHFRSKVEAFFDRAKFAAEISKFIDSEKAKDKKRAIKRNENFVIMGDLNGPRHEMAVNFYKRIVRPKPEDKKNMLTSVWGGVSSLFAKDKPADHANYAEYSKIVEEKEAISPLDYVRELTERETQNAEEKKNCEVFCQELHKSDEAKCKEFCTKEFDKMKKLIDAIKAERINHPVPNTESTWIEANSLITEKKIRVKEINFNKQILYRKILEVIKASLGFAYAGIIEAPTIKDDNISKHYQDYKVYKIAAAKKEFFDLVKFLKDNKATGLAKNPDEKFEETVKYCKLIHDKMPNSNDELLKKFKTVSNKTLLEYVKCSLLKAEKIDFILIDSRTGAQVMSVEKLKNWEIHEFQGFPNNVHPSDHAPSKVKISFKADAIKGRRALDKI